MKIYRGNVHEDLGTTLKASEPGEVKITMIPYIEEMVKDFANYDETMTTSITP